MNIKQIPNLLTILNLLTGCFGITLAFSGDLHLASFCIIVAALLDFLDGFTAKLLNAQSQFGKEFDSFADLISFGVLPAFVIFVFLSETSFIEYGGILKHPWYAYPAFLIAVFSALRLVKFNIDKQQKNDFIGLPTPANAMLLSSLALVMEYGTPGHYLYDIIHFIVNNVTALLVLTIISSALLISPFSMISLKFQTFDLKNNILRYILLVLSGFFIIIYGIMSVPLIIIFYIILSLLGQFKKRKF